MMKTVIKTVAGLTTSAGVGQVVTNIISTTMPAGLSKNRKVLTAVGALVASSILGGLASDHVEKKIDTMFADLDNFRNQGNKEGEA